MFCFWKYVKIWVLEFKIPKLDFQAKKKNLNPQNFFRFNYEFLVKELKWNYWASYDFMCFKIKIDWNLGFEVQII